MHVTVTDTVGQGPRHTDVSLWYALTLAHTAPLYATEEEFHAVRWFSRGAVPVRSDPYLGRFLAKLLGAGT
ncbi:MAG: hypothetical protein ABW252_19630 [Polyangiales bacterium]